MVYSKTDIKDKLNNKKDTDINNNINTEDEKALLSKEIEDIYSNLGFLVILDAVHNYNDGGITTIGKMKDIKGNESLEEVFLELGEKA